MRSTLAGKAATTRCGRLPAAGAHVRQHLARRVARVALGVTRAGTHGRLDHQVGAVVPRQGTRPARRCISPGSTKGLATTGTTRRARDREGSACPSSSAPPAAEFSRRATRGRSTQTEELPQTLGVVPCRAQQRQVESCPPTSGRPSRRPPCAPPAAEEPPPTEASPHRDRAPRGRYTSAMRALIRGFPDRGS